MIRIVESPREGLQGFSRIIPTTEKLRYINHLLRVGFDTVEVGSFVSPRLIPQMADSITLLRELNLSGTDTNIMFLAVNSRGVEAVAAEERVTHISFPFSFSPTFLKLNVNSTVDQSLDTVKLITDVCRVRGKQAVIYISMAFGNTYGDPWHIGLLAEWVTRLRDAGARIIPLSNVSIEIDAALIQEVFSTLIPMFPDIEFGLHLHTSNEGWRDKVEAAYRAGCRRFDGVINGWGGCPMAGKELLGNLKTENLMTFAALKENAVKVDPELFSEACRMAGEVYQMTNDE